MITGSQKRFFAERPHKRNTRDAGGTRGHMFANILQQKKKGGRGNGELWRYRKQQRKGTFQSRQPRCASASSCVMFCVTCVRPCSPLLEDKMEQRNKGWRGGWVVSLSLWEWGEGIEGRRRRRVSLSELAASRAARLDGRSWVDLAVAGPQVRLRGRGSHAVLDLCRHRHERLLDICGILGASL